jgi:F0F1-type ATP synthase assembly protein I
VEEKPSPGLYDLMTLGLSSALMIGIATGIGLWIDDAAHTSPYCTLGGLAFGVVAAIGNTIRQVRRYL